MDVQTQIMNLLDDVSPTPEQMIAQIDNLTRKLEIAENQKSAYLRQLNEIKDQVTNVKNHIFEIYAMNGEIDEDTKMIADLLDITLLKEIQGTALCEISWTAQVPLDFDADDFEISFDVNCEEYDAEDFDWNEEHTSVHAEEV